MAPIQPRPVVRDPDAKRRRILNAARQLLIERDFQEIVLDDVAKRAGVAKGTLFLYFKNKEDLFSAVFSDVAETLGLELEALLKTGAAGKELLVAAARVVLTHFDSHRDFLGHLGAGRIPSCGPRVREKLLEKYRANLGLIGRLLSQACRQGGTVADLEFAGAAFVGLCRSAAVRKVLFEREGAFEREAEMVVKFFVEGSGLPL